MDPNNDKPQPDDNGSFSAWQPESAQQGDNQSVDTSRTNQAIDSQQNTPASSDNQFSPNGSNGTPQSTGQPAPMVNDRIVSPANSYNSQVIEPAQNLSGNGQVQADQTATISGTPPEKNNKNKKRRFLIGGTIASAVIILLSLGIVFGWYIPNQPENVWNTGLDRTGSTLDKMIIEATEPEKLKAIKNTEMIGSIKGKSGGVIYSGSFNTKYDPKSSDSAVDFKYTVQGDQEKKLSLKLLAELPDNSDYPDMFFQLSGLSALGADQFLPGLSNYDGKWISISSDYLKTIIPIEEAKSAKEKEITHEEASEAARAVSSVTSEYIFTSDKEKSVLELREFIGTEELENGMKTNHYKVTINKDNAKKYCEALIESFMSTAAYKKLPGVKTDNIDKDKEDSIKRCRESVEKDIKEDKAFDMWVDKKYKLIHKVRLTSEDNEGQYVEVGQNFSGGDVMPLFVTYKDEKEKVTSTVTLDIDTVQSITKGTLTYNKDGDFTYSADGDFEFRPFEGTVKIDVPKGAIPIQDVLKSFGVDPAAYGNVQGRAEDTERQMDIKAMHGQLEVYYAENGHYPGISDFNNASWRVANMRGLDQESLKTPSGNSYVLAQTASTSKYGYSPSGCDGTGNKCKTYSLSAVLSNDTKYTKKSLI